ncbi:hypothetical protein Nepgr_000409 [Nepenthes gracilis]|uniref:Uncharacterized protein n=1 Tax=Nepenthes gracilis TaxID=150966 RepID=A0AAD3P4E8_NEPGR|nr:hypothetical protein Nepgr_000409 [Nepenthes gracilis]
MSHFSPPSLSPPVTPVKAAKELSGSLSISRMGDWIAREGLCGAVTGCSAPVLDELALRGLSYKDALNELMESFDGVNLNDFSWVNDLFNYDGDDHQQFVLSPSTPNTSGSTRKFSSFTANSCDSCSNNNIAINFDDKCNDKGLSGPDLGWVDDLLM